MAKKQRLVKRSQFRENRPAPARHTIAKQGAAVLALGLRLAAGGPAEASIIYTAVDPADQRIENSWLQFLNYSGVNQFYAMHLINYFYGPQTSAGGTHSGYVVDHPASMLAALLNPGTPINASSFFNNKWGYLAYFYYGTPRGDWFGKKGYLGLQFTGDDGIHYGWAKMEVPNDLSYLMFYGYAYETDVNTPILAGAGDPSAVPLPGSLALLASGALGLLAYRRMKRAA